LRLFITDPLFHPFAQVFELRSVLTDLFCVNRLIPWKPLQLPAHFLSVSLISRARSTLDYQRTLASRVQVAVMRVLCLHGMGTNSEIFGAQTGGSCSAGLSSKS
jgi:hypothetical protein